tara:strand:- start:313 stop:540 length:228 start_codon:yes stop_codon:yes gene_type:complete
MDASAIATVVVFGVLALVLVWRQAYKTAGRNIKEAAQMTVLVVGAFAAIWFAIFACEFQTGNDPYPLYCQDNFCD